MSPQAGMGGLKRSLVAAAILAVTLTGCSAGSVFESLPPSMGGLPTDAPTAPKVPYQYPAVHDMPPPRAAKPLDDSQQLKLEEDLEAARNRQINQAGDDADSEDAPAKPAVTKKKPSHGKKRSGTAPQAGATANP
jgi:hypothetical protein